ncbi:MAG: hypothetical protein K0R71_1338 [Bacillales bacterium]|jgi:uncharacterized membrane protein YdjX (TVP38/TMEM64 family)|nr:hypothetical protein [Bacillales bacterium]
MKKYWKVFIFTIVFLSLYLLNRHYEWLNVFLSKDRIQDFEKLVSQYYWRSVLIYILITVVGSVAFALPGVTFAIVAGILFGPWLGSLYCLIATTIGAVFAFIAGRTFLKDSLKPLVMKNQLIKSFLFNGSVQNEIILLFITRTLPIFPYNLQNFAYGISEISLWKYTLFTFVFLIPGVTMFTVGTVGVTDTVNRWSYIGITAGLILVVTLIALILKRKLLVPKP